MVDYSPHRRNSAPAVMASQAPRMSSLDGAPLTEGYILSGGITLGRPVGRPSEESNQESQGELHLPGEGLPRTWVNCKHLVIEKQLIEYPPGDPEGIRKYVKISDNANVWVMAVALERFKFIGQHGTSSPIKFEVTYGDSKHVMYNKVLTLLSQETTIAEVQGETEAWADFDSVLCFPWRSDVYPTLSLNVYQAGTVFNNRLPFAMCPPLLRQVLGEAVMQVPFRIQFPRKISQEVVLSHPVTGAFSGAIQVSMNFKQVPVGLLKKGGGPIYDALMTPESEYREAARMSVNTSFSGAQWVLGQPMPMVASI